VVSIFQAEESVAVKKRAVAMQGGTYRYFLRGKSFSAAAEDFQVESRRKIQLRPYEVYLKKFQYGNALNAGLEVREHAVSSSGIVSWSHFCAP
jgi:U3 small nucleolar RNA-associated protein 15